MIRSIWSTFHQLIEIEKAFRSIFDSVDVNVEAARVHASGRYILGDTAFGNVVRGRRTTNANRYGSRRRSQFILCVTEVIAGIVIGQSQNSQCHYRLGHVLCANDRKSGLIWSAEKQKLEYSHLNWYRWSFHSLRQAALAPCLRGRARKSPALAAWLLPHILIRPVRLAELTWCPTVGFGAQLEMINDQNCLSCIWNMCVTLTADTNFRRCLHRHTVSVAHLTGNLLHILGDILDDRDHVSADFRSHKMTANVQRNRWNWIAQCQTQNSHRSALRDHFIGMNRRRLRMKDMFKDLFASLSRNSESIITSTNAGNAGSVQATNVSDGKLSPLVPIATTYTTCWEFGFKLLMRAHSKRVSITENVSLSAVALWKILE